MQGNLEGSAQQDENYRRALNATRALQPLVGLCAGVFRLNSCMATMNRLRPSLLAPALLLCACSGAADSERTGSGGVAGGPATGSAGSPAAGVSSAGVANAGGGTTSVPEAGGPTVAGANTAGGNSGGSGGSVPSGGSSGTDSGGTTTAGGAAVADAGSSGGGALSGGGGTGGMDSGGAGTAGMNTGGSSGGSGGAPSGGMGGADSGGSAMGGAGGETVVPPEVNTGEPIGFATLNGGTSGGMGGETVTAASYDELKSFAESSSPYIIMVDGTISNGANGGRVNVASNKSIIGVGSTAFLNGVGLNISSSNNIIIQNLRVSMIGVTTRTDMDGVYSSTGDEGRPQILVNGGDAISIQGTSKNIWIDHCELFSEDPNVQTNKDLYDGLIDIKNETGFITISYCYLHDHHKGGLVGSSDSDLYDDRKITLHHNYYNNVKLRIPMYRGSTGHFFNNYIVEAEDATEIRADTCVRVEKNYYEPLHYSIYTPSDSPGRTERIDNIEVDRASRDYPSNCTADIPYSYSDVLIDNTEDVKTIVPQLAGVGKL